MNFQELNQNAINEFNNLKEHGYFEEILQTEMEMTNNKDPFDVAFYQQKQDILNYIYGEIENVCAELSSDLEKYIAIRQREIAIELTKGDSFKSGEETIKLTSTLLTRVLENIIKGEVPDLYKFVILLESHQKRTMNSIQSARNHTYGKMGGNYNKQENE